MMTSEDDAASVAEGSEDDTNEASNEEDNSDDGDGDDSDNSQQQQDDGDSVNDEESDADDGDGNDSLNVASNRDAASVAEGNENSANEAPNEDSSDDGDGNESDNSDTSRQHDDGDVASDEESDDDDDDDDNDDDEKQSESSIGDSDSDDGDESENEHDEQPRDSKKTVGADGLSEYERLRLERIKRNKERLIQLGLDGGFPKKKKQPSQVKRRKSTDIFPAGPKRRSRRSTDKIDYTEPSISITQLATKTDKENPEEGGKPNPKKGGRKERSKSQRLPRFIYDEFQSINQHKKKMLKLSGKNLRIAETEIGYWQKKAEKISNKEKKKLEMEEKKLKMEQMHKNVEKETQIFGGGSAKDFLQQIEKRTPEIMHKISMYEYHRRSEYEKIDTEVRHQQNSNKLKLLDALDSYPRATQQAAQLLNSMLSRQVPDDPPAPRRSKRKPEEEETTGAFIPPAKREKVDGQPIIADAEDEAEDSGRISNAATQASLAHTESHLENPPEEHSEKVQGNNNQVKKKRELQVGGWVSPLFSAVIDRSWLGKDTPDSCFDPKTYVPQPGDTVLYYPKGHRDFLKQFPDNLCKNKITRIPLWDRAKKEKLKSAKAKVAKNVEDLNGGASSTKAPPTWWNDEWLSNVEEGSLGSYPIVCRVEKGHAEFPPDPLADHKIVEADGTINWRFPNTAATAKAKKKAFLRLAVTLRPLTTVLPPTWTESGPVDVHSLVPPPPFTIQTFPSKTTPYLIPFVWGYISYHSLSLDDDITFPDSKAEQNGKIKAFASLGGCFGSCRLDDKRQVIANMLESWKHEDLTPKLAVPPQDAVVIREFLACCMSNTTKNLTGEASALPSRENVPFVDFIRCTLPLWNGISALKDVYDRREVQAQFWDVNARKSFLNKDLELGAVRDFMEFGIPRTLDSILRAKLECSLDHFLGENAAASPFRPDITDNIAPSYSHAVPISMSFDRILRRLTEKNWQSYYRSFDALLADLNAIQDNCALYNSPDSYLVHSANEIIPAAKKFLSTVVSRHVKERAERVLAEKEKTSQASAPMQEDKEYRKSVCPFREPFQGQLYREWLVSTQTDARLQRHPCPNGRSQWVPQAGDTVLYSRELHAEFIRGHSDDLQVSQVGLPQITTKLSRVDENDDEPTKNDYVGGILDGTTAPLHEWIEGRVIFARPEFPRQRKSTDEKEPTFMTPSPILGVKVQTGSKSSVVFWRPCMFACDMVESTRPPVEHCACCGLHLATSFLRQKIEDEPSLLPASPKLSFADQVPAIERALNLLKRRCINKTAVDYLRPSLTNKKVKEGYVPPAPKIGVDSLPSFEDELRGRTEEVGKSAISTRGVTPKRGADEVAAFEQLINCNYLPPWFGGVAANVGAKKEDDSPPLHESISPCPSLCLELIRLRLRNGYYRHKEAIAHDIVEAYTTSVLLYLAPFAEGKNPISMKKLVRVLNSTKYTLSRASTSDASKGASNASKGASNASKDASKTKKGKKSGALSKPSNQKMPKSPLNNANKPNNKKSLVARIGKFRIKIKISPFPTDSRPKKNAASAASGKALVKSGSAKASKNTKKGAENPANHSGLERNLTLTRREQEVVARLEGVRRLYTTALCIVGETLHFQHLNGLIPLAVSQKKICKKIQLPVESNFVEKAQAAGAHNVLTRLLQSIGRDSCTNRPKELEKKRPSVRVKFTVGGKPVKTETTVLIAAPASLAPPSMPTIESGTVPVPPLGESQTPAANSEPLHLHSQKSVVVVRDNVKFNYSDYEKNTQLCRFLWKRDGREYPCARCQAHKKSLAMCRVVKRHSNMDFSLRTFAKKGGVDGYLKVMLQQMMTITQPSSTESQAALSPVQVSRADKPGMASSSQSAICHSQITESSPSRENHSIKKTNNGGHVPSRTADPELCTSEARANEKVDNVVGDIKAAAAETPIPDAPSSNGNTEDRNTFGIAIESHGGGLHNIKPPAPAPGPGVIIIADTSPSNAATTTAEGLPSNENVKDTDTFGIVDETPDGALGGIETAPAETTTEKAPPNNDAAKDTQANGNVDPRDMYRRAQKALDDARELAASAKVYFEAPAVLSDKFINENFPWDDSDGHYAFCVVCGLSGDLLICEGCPNTVHPACVNFSSLPEGDWFCNKCPPKQSAIGGDHVEKTIASVNGNATDISAVDAVPSSANANEPLEKERIEAVVLSQPSNQEDPAVSNRLAIEAVTSRAVDKTADLGAPGIGGSKGIVSGVDEHRQEKPVANRPVKASTEGANDDSKSPNDTLEVGRIPMRVQFNEERATQLSAELDTLFFHRTGRERNAGKEKRKKSGREGEDEETGQDAGKPKAKFPVGYLIMKNFGVYGYFTGEVKSVPTDENPFFRVLYEDGDEEDLTTKELSALANSAATKKMRKKKKEEKAKGAGAVKKKRGRPRKDAPKEEEMGLKDDIASDLKKEEVAPESAGGSLVRDLESAENLGPEVKRAKIES